jgi:hypothetical protein
MPGSSWETMRPPSCGFGGKNGARSSPRTFRATSSSSSAWLPRTSIGDGTRRIPIADIQRQVRHPTVRWMGATPDGRVEATGAVFEAKFMLPWSFSEEAAAQKYMAQLQHNMWVVASRAAALSVITGGGKWVEITTHADPLYQHLVVTAERKFWRCVENGEPPAVFRVEPPKPRIEAVRVVDMSTSNTWAEFADIFIRTRDAHLEHEHAKAGLKGLVPDDAQQAIGHGVCAKRSKAGAISFELLKREDGNAAVK